MATDRATVLDTWHRYAYLRDNGHFDFMKKAAKCEDFFAGNQWDATDLALLKAYRRPALTINKIISTVSNVLGEQIYNRSEINFRPRNEGATSEVADALTKVFMQISDNNQLPWVRSDVFADGIITSRGFYDVRLDFSDALRGEVRIAQLNPRNVLIDSDADSYDPEGWSDVVTTKWLTGDDIELLYSKEAADQLRSRAAASDTYGYDAFDDHVDKFGSNYSIGFSGLSSSMATQALRNIRVIERQWRKLDKVEHFVDIATGDMRQVPSEMLKDRNLMAHYLQTHPLETVTKKLIRRVRWTVVAGDVVLHDDWSPYKCFTVVPFFPLFRRGRTLGLVENLLGPQELLNKVSSQELHVVNTTANSGWKVKTASLKNMSIAELEQRGAQTGLVLELEDLDAAEKITPNQIPSGLDRISYKAEEHIKTISGVSDYQTGFAREDVSAKALKANQSSGSANLAKVLDNLNRSDFLLARTVLGMVQGHYTEQRLIRITTDKLTNAVEDVMVNQPTPEGEILNNLQLGEYEIVVTSSPERDTFEDSQFDQAVRLRIEAGVAIPDKHIIMASRLRDKAAIVKDMEGDQTSPEAQEARELERRAKLAEVVGLEADAQAKAADAQLKVAKTGREQAMTQTELNGGDGEMQMAAEIRKMEMELAMDRQKMEADIQLQREKLAAELELKRAQMQADIEIKREQSRTQQAVALATAKNQQQQNPNGAKNESSQPA
jgi:hypothetical protein